MTAPRMLESDLVLMAGWACGAGGQMPPQVTPRVWRDVLTECRRARAAEAALTAERDEARARANDAVTATFCTDHRKLSLIRGAPCAVCLEEQLDVAMKAKEEAEAELAGCEDSENENACGNCRNCARVGMRAALDGAQQLQQDLQELSLALDHVADALKGIDEEPAPADGKDGTAQ